MLSTYYMGEHHDLREDRLSAAMERNPFSGGSQAIVKGMLPHKHAGIGGYIAMALACVVGLILQFYYKTGPWTVPLGAMGIMAGFFYSTPPVRWVARGIGEILIGFCYGWLPVAAAFYLQCGTIDSVVHLVALPIACTIFNVILINEFPDYPADLIAKKNNLVVRMGKNRAAFLYVSATIVAWITVALSVKQGLPSMTFILYIPVFVVSLALAIMMLQKRYLNRKSLGIICGLTIVVNLGTSLCYILALWQVG
jgi:1,4-dihydroxy-2-naphthoate octaprenyltransferase